MSQSKEQIEAAFRTELQALLDKYGAELEAKDHYSGCPGCGEDVRMTVDIPAIWSKDGDLVREGAEINLGSQRTTTARNDVVNDPVSISNLQE